MMSEQFGICLFCGLFVGNVSHDAVRCRDSLRTQLLLARERKEWLEAEIKDLQSALVAAGHEPDCPVVHASGVDCVAGSGCIDWRQRAEQAEAILSRAMVLVHYWFNPEEKCEDCDERSTGSELCERDGGPCQEVQAKVDAMDQELTAVLSDPTGQAAWERWKAMQEEVNA